MTTPLAKTTGGIGCALLTLPLLAALTAATALGSLATSSGGSLTAFPSTHALADIPPTMLTLYQQAATQCPGLPWTILAAIGKVETDHGRDRNMVSSAGAVGPMQFLPSTFTTYAHPVPPGGQTPPTPWDPTDAVYAAARLLCANGAQNNTNPRSALWHYNHSDQYVNQVLHIAGEYATTWVTAPTTAADQAVAFARAQLGEPYTWGGTGQNGGGFDCSGLTQAAYHAAGIPIPRTAQQQYDTGPHLPTGTPLLPGDLLFYGSTPTHITHVAIYTGNTRAIDAPHPAAVIHEAPALLHDPTFQGATRPAQMEGGDSR